MKATPKRTHCPTARALLALLLTGGAVAGVDAPPFRVERNVVYLEPHRTERADLYVPDAAQPGNELPAIVVIHGGGWRVGDKASPREVSICSNLATHGYVCMSINYLLTGDTLASFPTNIQDCKQAVRWLRKNAAAYSVDPDHIGAVGSSAGGHLAALLSVSGPEVGLDPDVDTAYSCRVQATTILYGHCISSWEHGDPPSTYNNLTMFASSRTADPDLWDSGSPFLHLTTDDPPTLLLHGSEDQTTPLDQSIRFQAEAVRVGLESDLIVVPGEEHGFDFMPDTMDLRPDVFAFFDSHLKPSITTAGTEGTHEGALHAGASQPRRSPLSSRVFDLLGREVRPGLGRTGAGPSVRYLTGGDHGRAPAVVCHR